MKSKILIPLMAGLALLCACKGKTNYEAVNNSNADSVFVSPDTTTVSKLVKTAQMRFKVKNVQKASEDISALTTNFNGMITHHETNSSPETSKDIKLTSDSVMRITAINTNATIIVKVPTEKMDDFMNKVAKIGIYVNERKMDISDKSLEYLSAKLKLQSRKELINQQKTGRIVIKHPENVLTLKDEMTDAQISNKQIDNDVKNSIISISFYENNTISKEIIANGDPSAYDLPFMKRLLMAFLNGWLLFEQLLLVFANLWAIILTALGLWIGIRMIVKKRRPILVKN